MSARTVAAHAKLNLWLRVLGREESGYHSVETLLLRLELADEVAITPGGRGIRLEVEGDARVPDGEANLCWRAADRFGRIIDRPVDATLTLRKRIPVGAGLGGGSADAGATLQGLNALFGGPIDRATLVHVAGELGSDVPFALCRSPMALAWERGRRLIPLAPPMRRPVLVVVPDFGIPTADAYGWLDADRAAGLDAPPGASELPPPADLSDWNVLVTRLANDFEAPVFRRHAQLESLKRELDTAGALGTFLCGSGSCVAALFTGEEQRNRARRALEDRAGLRTIPTWTETRAAGG